MFKNFFEYLQELNIFFETPNFKSLFSSNKTYLIDVKVGI